MNRDEYEVEYQSYRFHEMQLMSVRHARALWFLGFGLGVVVGLTVAVLWRLL